ncbi:MAG TPA: hypothetical protein VKG78_06055, partial [Opitutaceae bacterium]|nr:hypothetical protein [Opitutaceae bacterium]
DPSGTFSSKNLLLASADTDAGLDASAARLLAIRDRRPAPPRDDRATAGANGLMVGALARAGAQLGDARYIEAARRALGAVTKVFLRSPGGELRRLDGCPGPAGPEDYAAVAFGCRELARAAKDPGADALASRLLERLRLDYFDPSSRRYFGATAAPAAGLFVRPFASGDPPGAEALALLAGPGRERSRDIAAGLLDSLDEAGAQAPGDQLLALASFAEDEPAR